MDFLQLISEYYVQYRGDNQIPATTDPEWAIGAFYANTAIRRWANVDGEEWDELWSTAVDEGFSETYQGTSAFPSITQYTCPDNLQKPGGFVTLTDPVSGAFVRIRVLAQRNVQLQSGTAPYAYFTGSKNLGFTLNLNFTGNSNVGWTIDFPMYKTPTYFDTSPSATVVGGINEDGSTITECPDENFIMDYMEAFRFRSTRNFPAYQTAKADAEVALKGMQTKNGIGTVGDSWNLNDNAASSGSFGI